MQSNPINNPRVQFLKNQKIILASWGCKIKYHYQHRDWKTCLEKLFNKLILFSPRDQYFQYGKEQLNKNFIKLIEKENPDYILFSLSYNEFNIETLLKIKEISPKTILINYFGDDHWRFEDWSRYYALFFDYIITSEKENPFYGEEGISMKKVFPFQFVNCDFFKPLNLEKKYSTTFIGMPIRDRYDYIKYILKNKIDFHLFGGDWTGYKDLKSIYSGNLSSEDYLKVASQTKINLSFSKTALKQPKRYDTQFKGRILEIPATKSFILIEDFTGADKFSKTFQKIIFKNKEELVKKIKYYLKNEKERKELTEKLYKEVKRDYSLDKQFINLFKKIHEIENKKINHIQTKETELPKINKKTLILKREDFKLSDSQLIEKLKEIDYIGFKTNNFKNNSYALYFQSYALEKSKKQMSCCDYYVYSKFLGDYLIFKAKQTFKSTSKNNFNRFIQLDQLMVTKDYFIKNLSLFKKFINKKNTNSINLINEDNTVFISIPLVRVKELKTKDYKLLKKAFRFNFLDKLYSTISKKKLSFYPFKLLTLGFFKNWFIFKAIKEAVLSKENLHKIEN